MQERDGSFGFLIGQHAGEGEAGVVVDGDVQVEFEKIESLLVFCATSS